MNPTDTFALVIGPEHDASLFDRLCHAVESAGGSITELSFGVAGSQEIHTYQIALPSGNLQATAETYVGLSLSGPEVLVRQLAKATVIGPPRNVA